MKLANATPGFSVFYPYNQSSTGFGSIGPVFIVASEGIRQVNVYSLIGDNVYQTNLTTGRPREITVSLNGLSATYQSLDTAFISTRGGYIEMMKSNDGGQTRMIGINTTEILQLTPSINSDNNMDGYMWMNVHQLIAVGLAGDIWYIDASSLDPVETFHDVMPVGTQVLSVTGNSVAGLVYILYTLAGTLTLRVIDLNPGLHYDLVIKTNFDGQINDLIVDGPKQQVYITSSDGVNLHFVAVDTSTLTLLGKANDQLIPLSQIYDISDLRKSTGAIRVSSGAVYIPHISEVIAVDTVNFTWWTVNMSGGNSLVKVDRLLLDTRTDWIVGTSTHQKPVDFHNITSGIIIIDNSDGLNTWLGNRSLGYTSIGYAPIPPAVTVAGINSGGEWSNGDYILDSNDNTIYLADNGTVHPINLNICFSESLGKSTQDTDCLTFFPADNVNPTSFNVDITPQIYALVDDGLIIFPDQGLYAGNEFYTSIPLPQYFNQTFILKLTKAAYYDDQNHDQGFYWYATAMSGYYSRPTHNVLNANVSS